MSIIKSLLDKLYPPAEKKRILLLGNDNCGKTSILYRIILDELITTVPTIGFNVETHTRGGIELSIWDIGGCDKIRPLWKHYFCNTGLVVFVISSSDESRLHYDGCDYELLYADTSLKSILEEPSLDNTPILILINKIDLEGVPTPEEVIQRVGVHEIMRNDAQRTGKNRVYHVMKTSASTGEGINETLNWIYNCVGKENTEMLCEGSTPIETKGEEEKESQRLEALFEQWINREDEPTEIFLQKLEAATLESWDHYTHLRIAWLFLSSLDRREGMKKIFSSIKSFIERSPITKRSDTSRGTTFHETMTYFWTHMVHYAMKVTVNADGQFKTFLLMNPQLVNGGLFLHYYSKKRMLLDPEARVSVLLPDVNPLPSLIGNLDRKDGDVPAHVRLQPRAPLTDAEFLKILLPEGNKIHRENSDESSMNQTISANYDMLFGWGHDVKLRLIFLMLTEYTKKQKRRDVDEIFEILRSIEREHFHLTISYFWVQMISMGIEKVKKRISSKSDSSSSSVWTFTVTSSASSDSKILIEDITFSEFYRQPEVQKLRNALLYEKYYTRAVIDSQEAARELVLPNLKQFTDHL